MPEFSIFKIFQIFGIVSTWATKAFADGKVTLAEAVELAIALCAILNIPTELDLPDSNPTTEKIQDIHTDEQEIKDIENDLTGHQPGQEYVMSLKPPKLE